MRAPGSLARSVALLLIGLPAFAEEPVQPSAVDPASEQIFQLELGTGDVLAESIFAYKTGGAWLLPLRDIADALQFSIQVSSELNLAEGFVVREEREFRLDVGACTVLRENELVQLTRAGAGCAGIFTIDGDLFVSLGLLEQWWPVRFDIDLFKAKLTVKPTEKLPIEEQKERAQRGVPNRDQAKRGESGFPVLPQSRRILDGGTIEEQLIWGKDYRQSGEKVSQWSSDTLASMEVLGFDAHGLISIDQDDLQAWRLNFARRSNDGDLLGPLKATTFEFFDVTMPQLSLVHNSRNGRGLFVSSFPLYQPQEFGSRSFEGSTLPGWEVEIYQNGLLLDRQITGDDGRFLFQNVTLFYGNNQFELRYYGPRGERRSENRTIRVDNTHLRAGTHHYRATFLDEGTNYSASLLSQWGLGGAFTGSAGLARVQRKVLNFFRPQNYATLAVDGLFENFLLNQMGAVADGGGFASQTKAAFPFLTGQWALTYSRLLKNFDSELFRPVAEQYVSQELMAELTHGVPLVPNVSTQWTASGRSYTGDARSVTLKNRLTAPLHPLLLSHEYEITGYKTESTFVERRGTLGLDLPLRAQTHRALFTYTPWRLTQINLENLFQLSKTFAVNAGFNRNLAENVNRVEGALIKSFPAFRLSSNVSRDSNKNISVSLQLNTSLHFNSAGPRVAMTEISQATQSAAEAIAFVDKNRNGSHESGETVLPLASVQVNQQSAPIKTNEAGRALFLNLAPYQPADFSVLASSVENPMLRASPKGRRVYLRPGKTAIVPLPFVAAGEIEGRFSRPSGKVWKNQKRIDVALYSEDGSLVAQTRADRDGLYLFADVSPGKYRVQPMSQVVVEPVSRSVEVPEEGAYVLDQDFEIHAF